MPYEGLVQFGYYFPPFILDALALTVSRLGESTPVPLSRAEFSVLFFLVENPQVVFSQEEISRRALGATTTSIKEHISNLKQKLGVGEGLIETVRGKGYKLAITPAKIVNEANLEALRLFEGAELELNRHNPKNLKRAVALYRECIKKSVVPWGLPYVRIAEACINLGHVGFCYEHPAKAYAEARDAIEDAKTINPNLPDIYAHSGLLCMFNWEWENAKIHLFHSFDLAPPSSAAHSYYAHFLVSHRDFDGAIEEAVRASQLDPGSNVIGMTVPWMHYFAGDYRQAVKEAEKLSKLHDEHSASQVIFGLAQEASGQVEEAIRSYECALDLAWSPFVIGCLGYAHGRLGHPEEVKHYWRELDSYETHGIAYKSSYCCALFHAGVGDKAKTLDSLEHAMREGCDFLIHLWVEPRWEFLRPEPRYIRLLRQANLA